MKKELLISLALMGPIVANAAKPDNWGGVDIIPQFYNHKITYDGTQIVGESEDGGTIYYNIKTQDAYFYTNCTFGRGYVIADNGWVVGSKLLESDTQSNFAVVMTENKVITPPVFQEYMTSNIHSITPDASRVCGVVGTGTGMSSLPFYCDIDENGNFGSINILPYPDKDFFGMRPQYVSATWISEDGKVIAGQVVDPRGLFVYPIVYTQNEQGIWNYVLPSTSLFNMNKLPMPAPVGDFEQEFPDAKYPDPTTFMNDEELAKWNAAYNRWESSNFAEELSPYNNLDDFLTPEQVQEYIEAELFYNMAIEEYNKMNDEYMSRMMEIADTSVFFVRNAMALSADGKWLASSSEILGTDQPVNSPLPNYYYVPYLLNIETGEWKKIGEDNFDLITNQVFPNGDVICTTPANAILPPISYIYLNKPGEKMQSYLDYMKSYNPGVADWMVEWLTGNIPVAENGEGGFDYVEETVTGLVAMSLDRETICAGVMGYAINKNMYFTYIMTGVEAGVEEIIAEAPANGVYTVYNLNGVKIMETKQPEALNNLDKGIYIINGKKVKI